jgi:hypothetical protein
MDDRHLNREKYFQEQSYTTEKYVIPLLINYFQLLQI